MSSPIIPLLLAGGAGTRLWPLSRERLPKQFLSFGGRVTSYQQTLQRVNGPGFGPPIVITGEEFHFLAVQQAAEIDIEVEVLIEPMRRDSGPAVAAGAELIHRRNQSAIVLVLAADHVILDVEKFQSCCLAAAQAADRGHVVTFGIQPNEPRTSFGYINPGAETESTNIRVVERFVEKPDLANARKYLEAGYLWNSGNFLFRADILMSEVARYEPQIASAVKAAVSRAQTEGKLIRLDRASFEQSPSKSIDYAVMERTQRAAVIAGEFRWSDIGSWDALFEIEATDDDGNLFYGPVLAMETEGCLVYSDAKICALLGLKDLIVVTTKDAVMIMPRSRAQEIRKLVSKLKERNRQELVDHPRAHKAWGNVEALQQDGAISRIRLLPNCSTELETTSSDPEHWLVLRGKVSAIVDGVSRALKSADSIQIHAGTDRKFCNFSDQDVELLRVCFSGNV